MSLKKFKQQTTPDNGLGGDYIKISAIYLRLVSGTGWTPATICFDIYRNKKARTDNLAPVMSYSIEVQPSLFAGMTILEDNDQTLQLVYPLLKTLPEFSDAVDD